MSDAFSDKNYNGDWLSQWLKRRRMTHSDFAARIGIALPTVYLWVNSDKPLTLRALRAMRDIDAEEIRERMLEGVEMGEAFELMRG